MPRRRYPSDDRRSRQRPHLKIHLTGRNHPRYGYVFADLEARGIVWGLWLVAFGAHAGQSHDVVTLNAEDAKWITGRGTSRAAWIALHKVCAHMRYPIRWHIRGEPIRESSKELAQGLRRVSTGSPQGSHRGRTGSAQGLLKDYRGAQEVPSRIYAASVLVRNFARKQGLDSALRTETTHTPSASDSEYRVPNTATEGESGLRTDAESEDPRADQEERERLQSEEKNPGGEARDSVAQAWYWMTAAAAEYVSTDGWELSPPRRRAIGHLMASYGDRGPEVLAQVAHGFMARHEIHGERFDPYAALLPGTVLDAAKAQDRLEAFDRARAERGPPPWFPKGPKAGAGGGRMTRARDAAQGALDLLRNHDEGDEP